ncbi:MAG: retrotransposon gag domain-containing protein, partial [Gemmatimonadota bacterium]|nr:retrotransposon gag domain-containing protein [Gemmatimonadota bacterium]
MIRNRDGGAGVILVLLVLVALIAGGVWLFLGNRGGAAPEATEVSAESAARAEEKLTALRQGGETVRLTETEFTSLLRYSHAAQIPGDLSDPSVEFSGDTIRFRGRVPSDRLPGLPNGIRGILP